MDKDYSDSIEVEDDDGFHFQKSLTKEQIVLRTLQKCMDEGSKEMTDGGVMKRIINDRVYEIGVPNQKEIFTNTIKMFWSLIFPLIVRKYKDWCEQEIGSFSDKCGALELDYRNAKKDINDTYNRNKNATLFTHSMKELKSIFEQRKLDLYKEKLDFGIMVIERENWFGERSA